MAADKCDKSESIYFSQRKFSIIYFEISFTFTDAGRIWSHHKILGILKQTIFRSSLHSRILQTMDSLFVTFSARRYACNAQQ